MARDWKRLQDRNRMRQALTAQYDAARHVADLKVAAIPSRYRRQRLSKAEARRLCEQAVKAGVGGRLTARD
jgi:hypothetical protein